MLDKMYRVLLGAALLVFALYLVTRNRILGSIGGLLILLAALTCFINDAKQGKFAKKNKKEKEYERRNV